MEKSERRDLAASPPNKTRGLLSGPGGPFSAPLAFLALGPLRAPPANPLGAESGASSKEVASLGCHSPHFHNEPQGSHPLDWGSRLSKLFLQRAREELL